MTRTYTSPLDPKRTRAQVEVVSLFYKHGPLSASELLRLTSPATRQNYRRTLNNLYNHKYVALDNEHKYMVTTTAMRDWADIVGKLSRPASGNTGNTAPDNAVAKFRSFKELKEAVIAAPAPVKEQVPGGIDVGIEAVEAAMRSKIEAEVRATYRARVRSKVRLPFTIGGKTTTAYTIDEGLEACTTYMQAVNDFLSDI
jgi:hypothetical protein